LKKSVIALVILNTSFSFVQIVLAFLVKPFLYWLVPIVAFLGFPLGYKEQQKGYAKQDGNQVSALGILFLVNCAYFILIGILFLFAPTDIFTIEIMILSASILTAGNFEELGKFVVYIREE
jgi:hypothetical protein